ncbi:MAG: glutamine--fructose-6-phosphate aminotransferase, partial [Rhodobacteraceae bacterium]|nr:glutamine--fructose-6-phosphate aminotransferase [Paracoccaceae bacterium]
MCGIVGILGRHEVAPLILESLKRLEYRGYDSAGIATLHEGRLGRRVALGKLIALSDLLVRDPIRGQAGIGHTRWATHGAPSEANAHPHVAGRVAVVHNGIVENFRALRAELEADGRVFASETDTEVVTHLADRALGNDADPLEAVRATLARLEGAFALVFLFEGHPDLMIAARRGSPLAIGYGSGEMYLGSDAMALGPLTHRIAYLEEGDHARLTRAGAEIFDASGAPVRREVHAPPAEAFHAEKGPYKHFMAKEIHEQPSAIAGALGHYLTADRRAVALPGGLDFGAVERLTLVACGTAHYACHVAKYWFESLARL